VAWSLIATRPMGPLTPSMIKARQRVRLSRLLIPESSQHLVSDKNHSAVATSCGTRWPRKPLKPSLHLRLGEAHGLTLMCHNCCTALWQPLLLHPLRTDLYDSQLSPLLMHIHCKSLATMMFTTICCLAPQRHTMFTGVKAMPSTSMPSET